MLIEQLINKYFFIKYVNNIKCYILFNKFLFLTRQMRVILFLTLSLKNMSDSLKFIKTYKFL